MKRAILILSAFLLSIGISINAKATTEGGSGAQGRCISVNLK